MTSNNLYKYISHCINGPYCTNVTCQYFHIENQTRLREKIQNVNMKKLYKKRHFILSYRKSN